MPPLMWRQVVGSIATHLAHGRAATTSAPSGFTSAQAGHLPLLALTTRAAAQVRLQRWQSAPVAVEEKRWPLCFHEKLAASGTAS
eukprot:8764498-Heterocapsa_arctica.AAC.1